MITASLYQINQNILSRLNLPTEKRLPAYISYLTDLLQPMQRLNNILSDTYINGASYDSYSFTFSYNLGDRVIGQLGYNQAVFESLTSSNLNNSLNDAIQGTNSIYWTELTPNFIGINERITYSANKLSFEYALNRWFGGTFKQPGNGTSSIYIVDTIVQYPNFLWGIYPYNNLSYFGQKYSTGYILTGSYSLPTYSYTINVPYSLNITGTDSTIRNFADKYNYIPIDYNIAYYSDRNPSITIFADQTSPLLEGTLVNFSATIVDGGLSPQYQWLKNSVIVGTNSVYATSSIINGDNFACTLISSFAGTVPVASNSITFTTGPSVTIDVFPSTMVATFSTVLFVATPVFGGPTPIYQWSKNSSFIIGASGSTYSAIAGSTAIGHFITGDVYNVQMTGSLPGHTGPYFSNSATMTVGG